jgi:hypothetical protein
MNPQHGASRSRRRQAINAPTCHSALTRPLQVTPDPTDVDTATLSLLDMLPGGWGAGEKGGGDGGVGGRVQGSDSCAICGQWVGVTGRLEGMIAV